MGKARSFDCWWTILFFSFFPSIFLSLLEQVWRMCNFAEFVYDRWLNSGELIDCG